MRKYYIPVHMK